MTTLGRNPDDIDTMVVLSAAGELFVKALAALFVLRELGSSWKIVALLRYLKEQLREKLLDHKQYIDRFGEDMPEIRNWKWSAR